MVFAKPASKGEPALCPRGADIKPPFEMGLVTCNKANVLYKKYMSDDIFSGKERCLNFSKLEAECVKFNLKIGRSSSRAS